MAGGETVDLPNTSVTPEAPLAMVDSLTLNAGDLVDDNGITREAGTVLIAKFTVPSASFDAVEGEIKTARIRVQTDPYRLDDWTIRFNMARRRESKILAVDPNSQTYYYWAFKDWLHAGELGTSGGVVCPLPIISASGLNAGELTDAAGVVHPALTVIWARFVVFGPYTEGQLVDATVTIVTDGGRREESNTRLRIANK